MQEREWERRTRRRRGGNKKERKWRTWFHPFYRVCSSGGSSSLSSSWFTGKKDFQLTSSNITFSCRTFFILLSTSSSSSCLWSGRERERERDRRWRIWSCLCGVASLPFSSLLKLLFMWFLKLFALLLLLHLHLVLEREVSFARKEWLIILAVYLFPSLKPLIQVTRDF